MYIYLYIYIARSGYRGGKDVGFLVVGVPPAFCPGAYLRERERVCVCERERVCERESV